MSKIPQIINQQKAYFKTQKTKDVRVRLSYLKKLKQEIIDRESDIYEALNKDFKKSTFETFLSENGLVLIELDLVISKLKKWTKPERVMSTLLTFPSKDYIYKEPYGTVLIIGPWNYPFELIMKPLVMAIAAGNTVVIKPSELTPYTSQLVADIVKKIFPEELATAVLGGIPIANELLKERWDYIYFTGSVPVGKIIAQAAAKHLTPVTLELGGKTPCIIDDTANLKLLAKRLVWGKLLNAGQTCIAPDYIIVKSSIKQTLVEHLIFAINNAFGNIKQSEDYPRIINNENFHRIKQLLTNEVILFGGETDEKELFIAPTIVDEPSLESPIMLDEIFGPVLPILTYNTATDIEQIIWHFEKPLAFYVFSNDKQFVKEQISKFSFGGGVINDTVVQYGNNKLPFGGVGSSGIGAFHGKYGFDTFTHQKSIIKRGNWIDPPFRYAPYKGKLKLIKFIFKWLS